MCAGCNRSGGGPCPKLAAPGRRELEILVRHCTLEAKSNANRSVWLLHPPSLWPTGWNCSVAIVKAEYFSHGAWHGQRSSNYTEFCAPAAPGKARKPCRVNVPPKTTRVRISAYFDTLEIKTHGFNVSPMISRINEASPYLSVLIFIYIYIAYFRRSHPRPKVRPHLLPPLPSAHSPWIHKRSSWLTIPLATPKQMNPTRVARCTKAYGEPCVQLANPTRTSQITAPCPPAP